jgi:5-methylcytosine-specific restriction endonuclease McrA
MKKHVKIYLDFFGYDTADFVPCEMCGGKAVDIHHIKARGMGGSESKDTIENLMALCRADHDKYGDKEHYRDLLTNRHIDLIQKYKTKLKELK